MDDDELKNDDWIVKRVYAVDWAFDIKTGEGTKTTIENDEVVEVRPAHISELF